MTLLWRAAGKLEARKVLELASCLPSYLKAAEMERPGICSIKVQICQMKLRNVGWSSLWGRQCWAVYHSTEKLTSKEETLVCTLRYVQWQVFQVWPARIELNIAKHGPRWTRCPPPPWKPWGPPLGVSAPWTRCCRKQPHPEQDGNRTVTRLITWHEIFWKFGDAQMLNTLKHPSWQNQVLILILRRIESLGAEHTVAKVANILGYPSIAHE